MFSSDSRCVDARVNRVVLKSGRLALSTGRPGIYLYTAPDPPTEWSRFNIAAAHNKLVKQRSLTFVSDVPGKSLHKSQTRKSGDVTQVRLRCVHNTPARHTVLSDRGRCERYYLLHWDDGGSGWYRRRGVCDIRSTWQRLGHSLSGSSVGGICDETGDCCLSAFHAEKNSRESGVVSPACMCTMTSHLRAHTASRAQPQAQPQARED